MNDKIAESMANDLERNIISDISYIYSIFVPNNSETDLLTEMKNGILPRDMEFLDLTQGGSQRQLAEKTFISPYDIVMSKVNDRITEFYSEIQLSGQVKQQLEKYGDRADIYTAQFQKGIDSSMNNTIKAVINEIDLCIMQKKDVRGVITAVRKVLATKLKSLQKFLESSYGQMARYMILWEYQDKGYSKYIYMTEGENCDTCDSLDGQIFLISEAGESLPPMHSNCDCTLGILDENENIIYKIGNKNENESGNLLANKNDKTNWYDALLRIPDDAKKLLYNFLSAQTNRMQNIKNPIDLMDWFMLGYLSANKNRGQVMLSDPNLYNIGNWVSSGLLDTIKGTFNAEEPLSLQHWLDSFGLAATAFSAYNLANSNAAGTSQLGSSNNVKTGLDYLDDSIDDAANGAGKANKILWDSWQNYKKVYTNGQEYAIVGDRLYSKHAVERMQPSGKRYTVGDAIKQAGGVEGRSVSPQFVEDVINSVKPTIQPNGNLSYVSGTVEAITNPQGYVVTIMTK